MLQNIHYMEICNQITYLNDVCEVITFSWELQSLFNIGCFSKKTLLHSAHQEAEKSEIRKHLMSNS